MARQLIQTLAVLLPLAGAIAQEPHFAGFDAATAKAIHRDEFGELAHPGGRHGRQGIRQHQRRPRRHPQRFRRLARHVYARILSLD